MKQGFDVRIVSYEYIHSIKDKDFKTLIDAVNPKANQVILDGMCGYGAVGKALLKREKNALVYFQDESSVQIKRARENNPNLSTKWFEVSSLPKSNYPKNFFDTVVIKMGMHEVSKIDQLKVAKEIISILKPGGKFVTWDIMLTKDTQKLFQDVIRKKDELSGFRMLTTERYFFREDEFINTVKKAGFKKVKEFHPIAYRFSTRKRLESELDNKRSRLKKLNEYIRERFPNNLKKAMRYTDSGDDIQFNIVKKIFTMEKPR
jgi:ubiquinone/menaquinone biosynthesis C-methylase UbiE